MIRDPPDHGVIRFMAVVTHMISNIKKNKTKGSVILSHTTGLLLIPTESLHKKLQVKATLATNLSYVQEKRIVIYQRLIK